MSGGREEVGVWAVPYPFLTSPKVSTPVQGRSSELREAACLSGGAVCFPLASWTPVIRVVSEAFRGRSGPVVEGVRLSSG